MFAALKGRPARARLPILALLLLVPLFSCEREPGTKSIARQWLDGVKAMGEPDPMVAVVLYFDNLWHSVAYEVLAERTLDLYGREHEQGISALFDWFDSVEREAHERFYDRYGFYPAEYFPPREPHKVPIPDRGELSWAMSAVEWEKILRRHGLTHQNEIPAYLERWRAAGDGEAAETGDRPEAPSPGTYVELFYGTKSGGPMYHPQLVEELREDPLITGSTSALSIVCVAGLDRTEAESFRVEAERSTGIVEVVPCERSGAVLVGPLDEDGVFVMQHELPLSGRYLHLYAETRRVTEFRFP